MSRIFSILALMLGLLASPLLVEPAHAAGKTTPKSLQLGSVHALVYDVGAGKTVFAKNSEIPVSIASITKLMTAMVVLDAKLPLDEMITVDKEDRDTLKNTYSRIRMGSKLSRRDMLKLALMSSENRAASALGRHYPGGRDAFIKAMNTKARSLEMHQTRFVDSTGLSSDNVATAQDLVKLVIAANQYSLIRDFTTATDHLAKFRSPRYSLGFYNTNLLVRGNNWDIKVSKTGFTNEAGRCLVMLATVDERPVVLVLLDSYGKRTPVGDANRVRKWMETGTAGSVPSAAARNYERERKEQTKLTTISAQKNQG